MNNEELLHVLALINANGIGDVMAKKLISHCGSATAVFSEKNQNLGKIQGVGTSITYALKDKTLFERAAQEVEFINKNNIQYSYFQDDDYPNYLKHCFDAPILFFKKGNMDINNYKTISIVGTRQMTGYGKSVLEDLIVKLKEYNPVIISGLAYGVDIHAHKLALENKLQTVAVLAHGLDRIYPALHKKYADEMLRNGGLITDFWSGSKPDRENFVKRNRIVAGLSQATVVIESAEKGGSLITADIANSYNRDVFAIPGRITDAYSRGCNQLIKINKAAALTSAKDVAYILGWEKDDEKKKAVQKQLFVELSDTEKQVYNYLLKEGKQQLDVIALHCNLPIFKIATLLLTLELKGIIKPLPGKIFEAI
ncbi:DNA-processing protein DprA [Aureibaculum sp. 2210JD6-5]|uniref:DNA-processing protein DprA n=1 Tax=Aureibaculum sp. 2210JD6-5 TaxID=3103957 RepID=UPI002AAD3F63|nr:DNA-processing protein DprA [Aureibaculum sp. 2210JD6-5]MDY7394616.1 DNA-processing protein DprA [Aureibaculum sp. 2210JD6-5]